MKRNPVNSSNLQSVGYDEDEMVLEIEFYDGSVYQYSPVLKGEYEDIMESSSPGSYFRQFIRDRYKAKKIKS